MFHGDTFPHALPIYLYNNPMYLSPMGNIYPLIWFYIWPNYFKDTFTSVIYETPIILGDTVLRDIPGTHGFQFTLTLVH